MIDGRNVPSGSTIQVDLCIVGGGPAGISLALQYANRTGISVALVESGGREWPLRSLQWLRMHRSHLPVLSRLTRHSHWFANPHDPALEPGRDAS